MKKKEIDARLTQLKNSESKTSYNEQDIKQIIQNNVNNVNVEVNLSELGGLARSNPDLATKYLSLIEKNQAHIQKMDNELINLEKREQEARLANEPKDRAYNNRGQIFGFIVMLLSLSIVALAIYTKQTSFAITSVIGVLLLSLYHISGKKEQTAISIKNKKSPPKTSE